VTRNLENRIIKLEAVRRRAAGEMLLLWHRPTERSEDVYTATRGLFADGDRVLIAVWYGDDPPPAPRWHTEFGQSLGETERGYMERWLREKVDSFRDDPVEPHWTGRKALCQYTDAELWYEICEPIA
jgi:hypothetical protein